MGDGPALLKAIWAHPKEDLPRLQYADWLDGQDTGTTKVCSGTHSHDGQVVASVTFALKDGPAKQPPLRQWLAHGVLHDEDPRKPHHHCDAKCWVSDGTKERAELIRVQCELARTLSPVRCPECGHLSLVRQPMSSLPDLSRCSRASCRYTHGPFWAEIKERARAYNALLQRERDLLVGRWASWAPSLGRVPTLCGNLPDPPGDRDHFVRVWFARGFVARAEVDTVDRLAAKDWELARHLGEAGPLDLGVAVRDRDPDADRDGIVGWYRRPDYFSIRFGTDPDDLPPEIFDHTRLYPGRRPLGTSTGDEKWSIFDTVEIANAALAWAVASRCRALAGHGRLPLPVNEIKSP